VRLQRKALLARLALDHGRAQHQVGHHHRLVLVVEGEHVGGMVLAPVLKVQRQALFGTDDAHCDLSGVQQRRTHPAQHAVPRQFGAVARIGELQRQLQGRR
jgi:hypothetical protein